MTAELINIGFGNFVAAGRVVAVVNPTSSPLRRLREEAQENGRLVDATQGRKTRALIVLDSGHMVLSALQPETLNLRTQQLGRNQGQHETGGDT